MGVGSDGRRDPQQGVRLQLAVQLHHLVVAPHLQPQQLLLLVEVQCLLLRITPRAGLAWGTRGDTVTPIPAVPPRVTGGRPPSSTFGCEARSAEAQGGRSALAPRCLLEDLHLGRDRCQAHRRGNGSEERAAAGGGTHLIPGESVISL